MRCLFILLFFPFLSIGQNIVGSVQLYPQGNEVGYPIINLNAPKSLILEFDYLGEDAPYFTYKIEHYSADWRKSQISPMQYLKGFDTGDISNFEFSFNTNQLYTHYRFEFPTDIIQFKLSGNYMLSIYNDNAGEPILQKKFMVVEQVVQIAAAIENANTPTKLQTHHQIDFSVSYEGLVTNNPREEFYVNVMQNQRTDNELRDIKPLRFTNEELIYSDPFNQNFAAGNEFRWFNMRSIRFRGEGVAEILTRKDSTIHVYLMPDLVRKPRGFTAIQDFNGQYYILKQEAIDSDVEADYVYTHFTLKETEALKGKKVYVFGALTNWEIKPEYQLKMNEKQNLLEAVLYLKQGNYDYQYIVENQDGTYSVADTEGDFFRTENDYQIFVYYRPFGSRYDRLVGYQRLNSRF